MYININIYAQVIQLLSVIAGFPIYVICLWLIRIERIPGINQELANAPKNITITSVIKHLHIWVVKTDQSEVNGELYFAKYSVYVNHDTLR